MDQNIEKNENYLKTGAYYLGFTEALHPQIEANIQEKKSDFTLTEFRTFNNKDFDYQLNFKLSDPKGRYPYSLESYDVAFKEDPAHKIQVQITGNRGITTKESANLLMGLAVGKTTTRANVENTNWMELDFTKKDDKGNFVMNTYGEAYGFDMSAALQALEKYTPDNHGFSQSDIRDLKKGNMPDVVLLIKGKEQPGFLIAKPKERTIEVYDENGNQLMKQQGISEQQQERVEQQARQPKKQEFLNKLLDKLPRKQVPALVPAGEQVEKKGRNR